MIFEAGITNGIGLMKAIAGFGKNEIKNGMLILPENLGEGYMKFFDLGSSLKMMVNQSILKEDLLLKKNGVKSDNKEITFSFRNVFSNDNARMFPSVQVSSSEIDLEVFVPAGVPINTILIIVHVDLLKELLNQKQGNLVLQNIISGEQPYLYEEVISPEIQNIAAKIVETSIEDELSDFYLKLKAQELIYLFLAELLKRNNVASYPLNISDIKKMYLIRDKIIADLSIIPNVTELTLFSNMSESKMNRLFKQIFGNSIYNYYQTLRMNEAAYLIREEKLSVSETGYRLGFTNLSHFTRIFEKHIGLKPKKYSTSID